LRGRQRPGLHQSDTVTDSALVLLVVRLELARPPQDLAVERVFDPILDDHDNGLVHLVAHHKAFADLAKAAAGSGTRLGHASSSLRRRSRDDRALLRSLAHPTSSISTG